MPAPRRAEEAAVSVRRLPAQTTQASEPPRWEVSYGSEATGWTVIGWIEQHTLRGAKNPFYFATGIHPKTGKAYRSRATSTSTSASTSSQTSTSTR